VTTSARPELEVDRRRGEPAELPPGRVIAMVGIAYAGAAALGLGIGLVRHAPNVLVAPSWLDGRLGPLLRHATSLGLGVAMAAAVVLGTRHLVRTRVWAEALHRELRPMARALGPRAAPWAALASGVGEEILFRGALVPALGVIVSSAIFGLLHQTRGRARTSWMLFAAVMGLAFALLFRLTGSLLGPIVAHVAINALNLRFLVEHDPVRVRRLGGLLARPRR
jgi:hypothetical protein